MKMRRERKSEYGLRWQRIIAICAMISLIFFMLLTGVQIAVYGDGDYSFYRGEYEKYFVPHALNMDIDDIMVVTESMMDYLIGKEEVLSVDTEIDGTMQDFFNEQDRLHMADVRNLFLGGLKLRNLCLGFSLILIIVISCCCKGRTLRLLCYAYLRAFAFFAVIGLILVVAFMIDFTDCFTVFHKIFFTNNLWLFDESTDYMIRMLPEEFFSDMTIRIGMVFGIECIFTGGVIKGAEKIEWKIRNRNVEVGFEKRMKNRM